MSSKKLSAALAAFVLASLVPTAAGAITREETLVRARSYASYPWSATTTNLTATCKASYKSIYYVGDFVGLPYNWGGYQTLAEFDQRIASGQAAGAQPDDGVLDCTAGVDCSGFVSKAWNVGHFTTSDLDQTSSAIQKADLLPADVFNKAGYHVAMFSHMQASGEPYLVESYGYNVNTNPWGGWSHVSGYTPRRLNGITGTTAGNPVGTMVNPIVIGSYPYSDSRDTRLSVSRLLDACAAAPSIKQQGPEYVYKTTITQPGTLTVSVSDDAASDIDVQVLTGLATSQCVARHDSSVTVNVGCGTYYVVADTFGTGTTNAGNYTLNATFTPSGQPCGAVAGPPVPKPKGKLGDACAYPSNPNLPFCNGNLGADTCIYTSSSSFCSKPCATNSDCGDIPGGGCCQDISGKGENYCLVQSMCGGSSSGAVASSSGSSGKSSSSGGTSGGTSSGESSSGNAEDPGASSSSGAQAGGGTVDGGESGGGCSASGGSTRASGGALVAAGVLASLAIVWRRRRRRHGWPSPLAL